MLQQQPTTGLEYQRKPHPWAHFCAGAAGGTAATILTSPLDVVKTRLQSTLNSKVAHLQRRAPSIRRNGIVMLLRGAARHVQETISIIAAIHRNEGTRTLFRGLGPNLAGYVPATALKFLFYGNAKATLISLNGKENAWTHLSAGVIAGVLTCTATNPFWVVKTRLQLDQSVNADLRSQSRLYRNSLDCVRQTLQQEGVRGLYRGLSASYIGTIETAIQWALYEQLKLVLGAQLHDKDSGHDEALTQSMKEAVAAGSSKLAAAIALYPHEVLRTRLREAPKRGSIIPQAGLWQSFRNIIAREGFRALYGGLTPHLLRVVPSSAILFSVYEATLRFIPARIEPKFSGRIETQAQGL